MKRWSNQILANVGSKATAMAVVSLAGKSPTAHFAPK